MAVYRFILLIPFTFLTLLPLETTLAPHPNDDLIFELQQMKIKIAHLEGALEESIENSNKKSLYLEACEKRIDEMSHRIHELQTNLSNIKVDPLHYDKRLKAMEEEVKALWNISRQNNFNLHLLDTKALDVEERLEALTSQADKMADYVTEQWIHIQRLEQALQIADMRARDAKRQMCYTRCTFLKFINNLFSHLLQKVSRALDSYSFGEGVTLKYCISKAVSQLKTCFAVAKKYHHVLQGYIKQEMKRYEFMSSLINDELIFFLASALITFPVMSAWVLLSF